MIGQFLTLKAYYTYYTSKLMLISHSDWRLRLRLRLSLLTNQKRADSYTLLSDWSRDATTGDRMRL